jgi:large subunit ribosomal protein L35
VAGRKWHAESRIDRTRIEGDGNAQNEDQIERQKRFKVTATGKVLAAQAGKQHGMIKRTKKFIRNARGTSELSAPDTKIVKGYMPYDR